MTYSLEQDSRWRRLNDRPWKCPSCEEEHVGLFDLACDWPRPWRGDVEKQPNSEVLVRRHVLTEDFCILDGESFFVRGVLLLPILGSKNARLGFGVWSSLSKTNFDLYCDAFDSPDRGNLGPWFGWFANRLDGYPDTLSLKCNVHPQSDRQRPVIELEPTDHPLAVEQREGISFDRVLEIYAAHGHDIRPALLDA